MPKHGSIILYVHGNQGSLGRTAQDVYLDSHTAPELWLPPAMKLDPLNAWRDYIMNMFNSSGSGQRDRDDCNAEESLTNVDRLDRATSDEDVSVKGY